jgi:O-antigen/teichoic acid export membrane protein
LHVSNGLSGRVRVIAGVIDQGFAAGAGFAGSILLARWLPREEFGGYAVALGALAWLLALHAALITEPMLVFGPGRYADRLRRYVRHVDRLHLTLTVPVGLAGAMAALFVAGAWAPARPVLLVTSLLYPALAAPHLGRRALYAAGRQDLAAWASAVQCGGSLIGLLILRQIGHLDAVTATALLAGAGLAAGTLAHLFMPGGEGTVHSGEVWEAHLQFGRWGVSAAGLAWANANLAPLALPANGSLADTGTLRAATTLMAPMLQLNAALGVVLLPTLAALRAAAPAQMRRTFFRMLAVVGGVSVAFWLALATGGPIIARMLYAGRYPELPDLLLVIGLLPLTEGIGYLAGSALRSIERPADIVRVHALIAIGVTLPGVMLAALRGPTAAAIAMVASSGAAATLLLLRVRTRLQRP